MKNTYSGTKTVKVEKKPLELLELVMYGNRPNGEVDQAYEDLKKHLKEENND